MMYSHQSSWASCQQQEEEIAMLQQKIMEIHNKLIDQLDVCKEQELTIIELNLKLNQYNKHKNIEFDTFKDQSFGQHRYQSEKQNSVPNFRYYNNNHQSRDNFQIKNEILKADLEAMRNKVLMEITQKNMLKEELKQLKINHKKQISLQVKKFQGMENILSKLQQQHKNVLDKHQRLKRDQSQGQYDKISYKLSDFQQKYVKQKEINKRLESKNRQLMQQLQNLTRQNNQSYEHDNRDKEKRYIKVNKENILLSTKKSNQNGPKMQKFSINQVQKEMQLRDNRQKRYKASGSDWSDSKEDPRHLQDRKYVEDKRYAQTYNRNETQDKADDNMRKKRGFQQTKQLIKKLQQAEISMRKNRKQVV